jgi:hypothetical protein
MKLHDRYHVPGSEPPVYIGHRQFKDRKTGRTILCKKWHAEWNHEGKKFDESLKTRNKDVAIRTAFAIGQRIAKGEGKQTHRRVEWQEMFDAYLDFLRAKGRAPKTLEKYEYVLACFVKLMQERKRW